MQSRQNPTSNTIYYHPLVFITWRTLAFGFNSHKVTNLTSTKGTNIAGARNNVIIDANGNKVVQVVMPGSDGQYYTNTHYSDTVSNQGAAGIPFYKAGKLPNNTINDIFGD